jgi:folate-dependent phosphoribosylglycinamide formyltransferase PurN
MAKIADEVYAIQECTTVFPGLVKDFFDNSPVMQEYFTHVNQSENNIFGSIGFVEKNVRQLALKSDDLNKVGMDILKPALESDVYVVLGASYIKGELIEFLVEHKAINIHMGVSPYYRGSSTNFWAPYQGHIDMVGATIHMLSAGLDSGDILYHSFPKPQRIEAFDLGMMSVKVAIDSVAERIKSGEIFEIKPEKQDRSKEISYTRNKDFTDDVARDYLDHLPTEDDIFYELSNRDVKLFKDIYLG